MKPVQFTRDAAKKVKAAVRRLGSMPTADESRNFSGMPRGANLQWVAITDTELEDNRYPGSRWTYDQDTDTFEEQEEIWVTSPNAESLSTDYFYLGRGQGHVAGVGVFAVDERPGTGITSINALTAAAQILQAGSNVTIVSAGDTHTISAFTTPPSTAGAAWPSSIGYILFGVYPPTFTSATGSTNSNVSGVIASSPGTAQAIAGYKAFGEDIGIFSGTAFGGYQDCGIDFRNLAANARINITYAFNWNDAIVLTAGYYIAGRNGPWSVYAKMGRYRDVPFELDGKATFLIGGGPVGYHKGPRYGVHGGTAGVRLGIDAEIANTIRVDGGIVTAIGQNLVNLSFDGGGSFF